MPGGGQDTSNAAIVERLAGLRELLEERTGRLEDLVDDVKETRRVVDQVERQLLQRLTALSETSTTLGTNVTRLDDNQRDIGRRLRLVEDQQTKWKAQMAVATLFLVPLTSLATAIATRVLGG